MTLLLAPACHRKQDPEPDPDPWNPVATTDMPVTFAAGLTDAATKDPLSDFTEEFHVFSFYQPGTIGGAAGRWTSFAWTPNFMYEQVVTYETDHWGYTPIKYWPNNEENTLTFWAYCLYDTTDAEANLYGNSSIIQLKQYNEDTSYGNTVHGLPEMEFNTNGKYDLMVSDLNLAKDLSYRGGNPATGIVPIVFHHALSWVDFRVYEYDPSDISDIYLRSIEIRGIYPSNVYYYNSGWQGGYGDLQNITVLSGGNIHLSTETPTDLPSTGKIMPVPQYVRTPNAKVYVTYAYGPDGCDPEDLIEDHTEFRIGSLMDEWEEGYHYTFVLNIAAGTPILFEVQVEQWTEEKNGFFNVN